MNRAGFQQLAKLRVKEGRLLLDNGHYSGAYYLLGYAIECALKACIAKNIQKYDFPDKKMVTKSWNHDLTELLGVAQLQQKLDTNIRNSPNFAANWAIVKDWKVETRYEHNKSEIDTKDLYSAITARKYGVLSWIKKWW